jgi:hypothetical protein
MTLCFGSRMDVLLTLLGVIVPSSPSGDLCFIEALRRNDIFPLYSYARSTLIVGIDWRWLGNAE